MSTTTQSHSQSPLTSPTKPLASRSTNTSPTKPALSSKPGLEEEDNAKSKNMDYHRQVLQNRLADQKAGENVYISPSDTIMSPCTKKLNGLKMERFGRAKPQSLFAKMDKDRKAGVEGSKEGEGVEEGKA